MREAFVKLVVELKARAEEFEVTMRTLFPRGNTSLAASWVTLIMCAASVGLHWGKAMVWCGLVTWVCCSIDDTRG